MGRHPKMDRIEEKCRNGKEFKLTRKQYLDMTGIDLPQNAYYARTKSALAKVANKYGYSIEIIPETVIFRPVRG